MIPEVPRGVEASTKITEQQVLDWIASGQSEDSGGGRGSSSIRTFHALHNAGVSAQNLNHARAGLSKALNTSARWAPRIVNLVDVNGRASSTGSTFGTTGATRSSTRQTRISRCSTVDQTTIPRSRQNKLDLNGKPIRYASLAEMVHKLKPEVTPDEEFARLVWARVLKGNAEGADEGAWPPPNIHGSSGSRKIGPNGQDYVIGLRSVTSKRPS